MTKMKRIVATLCSAAAVLTLGAQQLNKEITIERNFTPTLGDIARIATLPTVVTPAVNTPRLTFSDMTTATDVEPQVRILDPSAPQAAIAVSDYRGYAAAGYFPTFNLGASAGYRVIDKPHTLLGVWAQYDGNSYKDLDKTRLQRNTATGGADFTKIFRNAGRLDISGSYTWTHYDRPTEYTRGTHTAQMADLRAIWSARNRVTAYYALVRGQYFGFDGRDKALAESALADNLKQAIVTAKGGAAYRITGSTSLAASAGLDVVHYNVFNRLSTSGLTLGSGRTMALLTLEPTLRYHAGSFNADLGAVLQITTRSNKTLHVAPHVSASIAPLPFVTVAAEVTGGEHINRLSTLFDIDPYMSPSLGYKFSHMPIAGELRVLVGPKQGLSLEAFAGYAAANDWLMPYKADDEVVFQPVNMRSWHAGANVVWTGNSLLSAKASYAYSPGTNKHAWYGDADRARHVASATVTVRPIAPLTVDVNYTMRLGRGLYTADFGPAERLNLRDANILGVSARYAFTPALSFFARIDNILDCRSLLVSTHARQGFTGLIGAEYKF